MRALITSLSTYSSPFNDAKLVELGRRLEHVTAVSADVGNLWGIPSASRTGEGHCVRVLETRFTRSPATTQLRGLKAIAQQARPTVIHIECEPWQAIAVQSVRLALDLDIPAGVQFAENGPLLRGAGGALRTNVARWVLKRCCYAVGWSNGSADVARALAPGLLVETYPGTGVTQRPALLRPCTQTWFGADADDQAKVAFVGRFAPEKGFEDFLVVADGLMERMPIRVAIAGGSRTHPALSEWLVSRPWAHGHGVLARDEVAELLAAADVVVCPSRTTRFAKEQFGKVPVEAMSLGTPVFAFACGALPEVIGTGGVVVPEGAVATLVDELERFFSGAAEVRSHLANQAYAQARRFQDSELALGLVAIWSDLCSSPSAGV